MDAPSVATFLKHFPVGTLVVFDTRDGPDPVGNVGDADEHGVYLHADKGRTAVFVPWANVSVIEAGVRAEYEDIRRIKARDEFREALRTGETEFKKDDDSPAARLFRDLGRDR